MISSGPLPRAKALAMVGSLRAARLNDRRYSETGLSAADADALIPHLVEFTAERRTNAECEALLNARLGADHPDTYWRHVSWADWAIAVARRASRCPGDSASKACAALNASLK